MNPKDENKTPVSRFGFRFQQAKFSDKKQNGDLFIKNSSRNSSHSNPTQNFSSKHLIKQQIFVAEKDGSMKKKSNANELYSDLRSTSSSDSVKKTSCNSASNCSRGHLFQVSDPVASRRSRSRDACRELKGQSEVKETTTMRRDRSLRPIKSRSKSREQGLKTSDVKLVPHKKPSDDKQIFKIIKNSGLDQRLGKCPPPNINVQIKNCDVSGDNCTNRDSQTRLVDQDSLNSDLNFLKKKLMELKNVLTVGTCPGESVSSIKEENILLREENGLLKEKIKKLEGDLDLKIQKITEMNEKFTATRYSPSCLEDEVNNLHDSPINFLNHNHANRQIQKKRSNKTLNKDSNENISCAEDPLQNSNHQSNCMTLLNETLADVLQIDQKNKRPSQLPMRPLTKKSLIIPKKLNKDKISPSGFTTLRQLTNLDSKQFGLQADHKSQRILK